MISVLQRLDWLNKWTVYTSVIVNDICTCKFKTLISHKSQCVFFPIIVHHVMCPLTAVVRCSGAKTQSDSMSQNTRKALPRNLETPNDTPPSTLIVNNKGLNISPKRAVRDPKTGRGTYCLVCNVTLPFLWKCLNVTFSITQAKNSVLIYAVAH